DNVSAVRVASGATQGRATVHESHRDRSARPSVSAARVYRRACCPVDEPPALVHHAAHHAAADALRSNAVTSWENDRDGTDRSAGAATAWCDRSQERGRRTRAGTPTTTAFGGISAVTTAPAPTIAPSPTRRPGMTVAPTPTRTPEPIVTWPPSTARGATCAQSPIAQS